jgi:xylulokinase
VGGGARSAFWARIVADATGLTLDIPAGAEVGAAFGAARLGMLASGLPESQVCTRPPIRQRVEPGLFEPALVAQRKRRTLGLYRPGAD